jgi:hypothetical protein
VSAVTPSLIRTVVPLIVGTVAVLPIAQQLGVTDAVLTPLITLLVTRLYYWIVRLLEDKVDSRYGWLLGLALAPTFPLGPLVADDRHRVLVTSCQCLAHLRRVRRAYRILAAERTTPVDDSPGSRKRNPT